jgi:hypothetical protein
MSDSGESSSSESEVAVGRPSKHIDVDVVLQCREVGLSGKNIALQVEVSDKTLYTWRKTSGFEDPKQTVSEEELDALVKQHNDCNSGRGAVITAGFLLGEGIAGE